MNIVISDKRMEPNLRLRIWLSIIILLWTIYLVVIKSMSITKIEQYMFLFTRRRKRLCIVTTFFIAILFVFYQLVIHHIVSNNTPFPKKVYTENQKLVQGTHVEEKKFYTPIDGKFICFKSGEIIDFKKVNDNYCDCADSTDEPGTNACPDGTFYCSGTSSDKKYPNMIPSTKVNDGICDCCDGSEEYEKINLINNFDRMQQKKTKHFLVPCPNMC